MFKLPMRAIAALLSLSASAAGHAAIYTETFDNFPADFWDISEALPAAYVYDGIAYRCSGCGTNSDGYASAYDGHSPFLVFFTYGQKSVSFTNGPFSSLRAYAFGGNNYQYQLADLTDYQTGTTNGAVLTFTAAEHGPLIRAVQFQAFGGGFKIDNLTYSTTAVPEAATWAMLLSGLGVAGAAMRRRRRDIATGNPVDRWPIPRRAL